MFRALDSWKAKDDAGREVELLGRTGVRLLDNGVEYFVDSEMMASSETIAINVDEIFLVIGGERTRLDGERAIRVGELVIEGLRALSVDVEICPEVRRKDYMP